jgi:ABC-type nitrate/sulfonate/bicarbonate transport system ATPase subunit
MAKSATKVHLRNVYKAYGLNGRRLPVLEGIDLYASEGEFVSIVGPSGCGKTTLLNTIAGLQQPESGAVELDGVQDAERLGQVGYMQQKDLLMPWRTVVDNAILGLEVRGVPRKDARQRAENLLEPFGLDGFGKHYPGALSGGMRQRAAFLRTFLTDRDVLLLDEPFGALDALTRSQMQEWLMGTWADLGKTIVLITHDVEEAILLSDVIYMLSGRPGRVKRVVEVDLPRPRSYRAITEPQFNYLKADLLAGLREESVPVGAASWR